MSGWISLHRAILEHWIFKKDDYFKAWITILLKVNHEENKEVLIGNDIFKCGRGESLNSLDTWATLFGRNWNKSKVRRFFELLIKNNMIVTKSERKTTRLSVINYDTYQMERNANETQVKRKRNASETQTTPNNNDNNDNNDNKKEKSIKKKHLEFVLLTDEEMEKLVAQFGESGAKLRIGKLNDYIGSKGKKYKSHYHTILTWARNEPEQKKTADDNLFQYTPETPEEIVENKKAMEEAKRKLKERMNGTR